MGRWYAVQRALPWNAGRTHCWCTTDAHNNPTTQLLCHALPDRLPRKLSKLDEAMAVIKGRLSATAFKLLWGQRAYKDHLEQASRCPSVLQASVPGDIAHLDEEEEKELAEAVPSQVFEPPTPEELLQLPEVGAHTEWRWLLGCDNWHNVSVNDDSSGCVVACDTVWLHVCTLLCLTAPGLVSVHHDAPYTWQAD